MIVRELIEQLQELDTDQEMEVFLAIGLSSRAGFYDPHVEIDTGRIVIY